MNLTKSCLWESVLRSKFPSFLLLFFFSFLFFTTFTTCDQHNRSGQHPLCFFCVWIDHIRTLLAIALQSHVKTGVIQSINQSSSDFAAHESAVGMLLSCRCTSQITPEGNYQAINPDIRRMAAAYLRGREKERGIHTTFFHRRHDVSPRGGPHLAPATDPNTLASERHL